MAQSAPGGGLITAEPTRVAAVIIAHNGESFIEDAIRSVFDQTRPVDEIVVVDDGSTDSTADLVRRHPGVRLVSQSQQGPSAARNRGAMETDAEFIAFLDCDDMWLPQKTAAQLAVFETHPDAVAVSGGQIRLDEVRQQRRPERFPGRGRRGSIDALVSWNTVGNPSMVVVRRLAFEKVGRFDPTLRYGEDWELWLRLAQLGPIEFVKEPVSVYRWHPENLTHRTEVRQPAWNRRFQMDAMRLVPLWRRPLHAARAQSRYLLETAELAHRTRASRPMRLVRGLGALLLDPLALTRRKATMVFRAVVVKPTIEPGEILPPVNLEQGALPTISAVILTYNGEQFLADAIESVLAQTRRPDEILVFDNGSTDRSADIAGSYPGVRVVTLEENIGASAGYNRAAELAEGEYIAFLDHDDVWLPQKLALQLAVAVAHPETAVISGGMVFWDVPAGTMRETGEWGPQGEAMPRSLVHRNHVGNLSVALVRRDVFLDLGGMDPRHPWADDWDLWLRIAEHHDIRFVAEPVVRYRWHVANTSNQKRREAVRSNERVAIEGMRRLLPRWQWPIVRLRIRAWHLLQMSHVAADQGHPLESGLRAVMALSIDPFSDVRPKLGNVWRSLRRIGRSISD